MSYVHPEDRALRDLHNSMDYNTAGEPILRVGGGGTPGVNTVEISAGGVGGDAFGRLRVSQPFTLFDSSHRFSDNDLWATSNTALTSVEFIQSEGVVDLTVPTTTGTSVFRETNKVFSYQPGKSLLIMNTFVMAPAQTNLTQKVGYFGTENGMYVQLQDSTVSFVERSSVTGSMTETVVDQADWNIDKLDGTGPSGYTLDINNAQISWIDVEWLGLGTVRMGFVINGKLVLCHSFHHANIVSTTYITTASLPLRYEIINDGGIASPATLKQVCSTVISEGGYALTGRQQAVGTPITSPAALETAGVFYPVVSIRLKTTPNRLDAIVIPTALSTMGVGNGVDFEWRIIAGGTVTAGSWVSAGDNSAVDYNLSGTAITGGRILASGFLNSSNQGSPTTDMLKEALFKFQLERNTFTNTAEPFTIAVAAATNDELIFASMDWEEVTR